MIYPKAPFCPMNDETNNGKNSESTAPDRRTVNDDTPQKTPQQSRNNTGNNTIWPDDMQPDSGSSKNMTEPELMRLINELSFAVTDLNLFLDTHPNDEEALKTFTMLAAALKSYAHDYAHKFGTLYATDATDETPFEWVAADNKWPWQL